MKILFFSLPLYFLLFCGFVLLDGEQYMAQSYQNGVQGVYELFRLAGTTLGLVFGPYTIAYLLYPSYFQEGRLTNEGKEWIKSTLNVTFCLYYGYILVMYYSMGLFEIIASVWYATGDFQAEGWLFLATAFYALSLGFFGTPIFIWILMKDIFFSKLLRT